jgi:hypothetical protein
MTDLSPAAQAVDFAVHGPSPYATRRQIAAAALQAAADQVVPAESENEALDFCFSDDIAEWAQWSQRQHTRLKLLAIAAELKATN